MQVNNMEIFKKKCMSWIQFPYQITESTKDVQFKKNF